MHRLCRLFGGKLTRYAIVSNKTRRTSFYVNFAIRTLEVQLFAMRSQVREIGKEKKFTLTAWYHVTCDAYVWGGKEESRGNWVRGDDNGPWVLWRFAQGVAHFSTEGETDRYGK